MRSFITTLLGSSALVASAAIAQTNPQQPNATPPQTQASIADCDSLATTLEQRKPANAGVTADQVKTWKRENNTQACRDALVRIDPAAANQAAQAGGADASRIVVQQPAPTVRVEQASPQVTVAQPQPNVTVRQPVPDITVRQPAPTVTVDIPQPEITLRMPQPDVSVAMAQPEVQVNQPKPQVHVAQPGQPQVQVQPTQPQVTVQSQGNAQPQVQVQRADQQPKVHYERAEPKVIVNPPKGEPTVRVERIGETQQANAQPQNAGQQQRAGQPTRLSDQDRANARRRLGTAEADTTGSTNPQNVRTQAVTIGKLDDMDVYNARGERLGDVDQVIADGNNRRYVVIAQGGFLGLGEDKVAFPLDRFWMRGDRLVIRGVTEDEIGSMANYRDQIQNYKRVAEGDRIDLRTWQ